jgi:hypothetical protein
MTRTCGTCTLCCKLMGIVELEKRPGAWCGHCDKGRGCTIYARRPPTCRDFSCMWLANPETMGEELRPDRCRVVIVADAAHPNIVCHVDPGRPGAMAMPALQQLLARVHRHGKDVLVSRGLGLAMVVLTKDGRRVELPPAPDWRNAMPVIFRA